MFKHEIINMKNKWKDFKINMKHGKYDNIFLNLIVGTIYSVIIVTMIYMLGVSNEIPSVR